MRTNTISLTTFIGWLLLPYFSFAIALPANNNYQSVAIITENNPSIVQKNIAQLFQKRLLEAGVQKADIFVEKNYSTRPNLVIILGKPQRHNLLAQEMEDQRIPALSDKSPGPEGFLLQLIDKAGQPTILAAGWDDRGCLYAVGEILRQIIPKKDYISLPEKLQIRTAPAFEIRGTQFGQSRIAKNIAKVRNWSAEENQRVILDYALAGANIFPVEPGEMHDFIKSFGLMSETSFGANTAGQQVPLEWDAFESIGRKGYVCLSVPEARAFMLEKCEERFKNSHFFDLVKFQGGDGGGCECERCNPYGLNFIQLIEDMAKIIHKYHPKTKIYFTNQKFDNEDDEAIFEYLNEKPRAWLWAWGYGPGSDATTWQPGHRQTHRMDLFQYPGFGPYGLYPQEIIRQIPRRHSLVYYNEITHWKYAQHAYIQMYPRADRNGDLPPHWSHEIYDRRPDQFLTQVYNRLTFYAWPKYYHRVFNDLMRYGIGDITHSSGHHDHFNQWMWQRLLWSPRMTVDQVVQEYCITWFGLKAAPFMAKALLVLEENIEEKKGLPLDQKAGIDEFYQLVEEAGQQMPNHLMKDNWLWRMFMQKAVLDKYIQLDVIRQKAYQTQIENQVATIIDNRNWSTISAILDLWEIPAESKEMLTLKEKARILGEESNQLFGQRVDGYFNLKHDYIGLGWLHRQLNRAMKAEPTEAQVLLQQIVSYEDPGPGGFYDNLGTFNDAPNVINGYPYDHGQPYVDQMLSEENRPSQRSMHFTQDEDQGVTLLYKDLDPTAQYSIQFTLVRPWFQERYADRMNQKSEKIYADDILLVEDVELPLQMSDFYSFSIPKSTTSDGELRIQFERAANVARGNPIEIEQWRNSGGWGTIVSEAWLIKEE